MTKGNLKPVPAIRRERRRMSDEENRIPGSRGPFVRGDGIYRFGGSA
jgi:hypothetical protein